MQLDLFPRTQIDVDVQILQNDGSERGVNAVSVAPIDADSYARFYRCIYSWLPRPFTIGGLDAKEEMVAVQSFLSCLEPGRENYISRNHEQGITGYV